jgi:4-amino-4-deoxy-L-arabinose transferase-like glycosyltransferase
MEKIKLTKEKIAISLIVLFSLILNFANLSIQGYANEYYAAGVKSMTMSLSNFFFVAFDPAGFVTIDKPPLGFMIQAISAKIFGYSGWSILFPQALAGGISVLFIYLLVKKPFGSLAGLLSAFCLAITPMFVAVSKNNTLDGLLVMTLLIALFFLQKAAEKGSLKDLAISLAIVGLGFNIKMLEAYMIVPAIYVAYILIKAIPLKKRMIHLALASVVLVLVSLSWAVIVDLVPASERPYVGSSSNNSELELIFGHNGIERLTGSSTTSGGGPSGGSDQEMPDDMITTSIADSSDETMTEADTSVDAGTSATMTGDEYGGAPDMSGDMGQMPEDSDRQNGGGLDGSNSNFGGSEPASILRLLSDNGLTDQISWFLPLALMGLLAALWNERKKNMTALQVLGEEKQKYPLKMFISDFDENKKHSLIIWTLWLVPVFAYFSFTTSLFHPYYLIMLAPPIAALAGIGLSAMREMFERGGKESLALPIALTITSLIQMLFLSYALDTSQIAKYLMIATGFLSIGFSIPLLVIALNKNREALMISRRKWIIATALIAFAGLALTPLFYAGTTIFYKESGTFPSAGLSLMTSSDNGSWAAGSDVEDESLDKLVSYLQENTTDEQYLLAVSSASGTASSIIINYGESVMALGGFSGSDNILTVDEFAQLVEDGVVSFAMVDGQGGGQMGNDIMSWIQENGTVVDQSLWSDTTSMDTSKQTDMSASSDQLTDEANQPSDAGITDSSDSSATNTNDMTEMSQSMSMGGGMNGSATLYDLRQN